jgi:hypothetical protein
LILAFGAAVFIGLVWWRPPFAVVRSA